MKILVTGGGGFLGKYIVKKLISEGHEVSNFSRSDYPELTKMGVNCIKGNLTNLSDCQNALKDIDVCFHVASKVAMWGKWEDFYSTNIDGTKNIIKACLDNKVTKLIYTSTPSVVFEDQSLCGVGEEQPYANSTYSLYAKSKTIAEKEVLSANSNELKTIALRPHLIWGPGDQNLIPNLVNSAKKGRLKIIGDGQNEVDIIFVENAADAHIKALHNTSLNGKAVFIGQGPVKLWEFVNEILELYGEKPITKTISFKKAFFAGNVIEKGLKLIRKFNVNPPMTRFVALQLSKSHYFSHKRASEDLNWTPRISKDEGLKILSQSSKL